MNPTLEPSSTAFIFTLTPADLLRHAALYIEHFGWMTHAFYQRDDLSDLTPAACATGAIGAAVYGTAHKNPDDEDLPSTRSTGSSATRSRTTCSRTGSLCPARKHSF